MLKTRPRPYRRNYRTDTGWYGRWAVLGSLGPVVYAMHLSEGTIKIGFTSDLADRERTVRQRSGSTVTLLAFRPGSLAEEQAVHAGLTAHLAHGREYYRPEPEVVAVVNEMRDSLGLPAWQLSDLT